MNPLLIETILREKRTELLQEAERQRLVAQYQATTPPSAMERMLTAFGDLLIELGTRLKQHYSRQTDLPLTIPSPCKDS